MSAAIFAQSLTKRYGRVNALREVSLSVPCGSIFAIAGPNGAGKSTALKTILNLQSPTSGRAEVLGVDSRRLGAAQFTQIGYCSENQRLPESMTVARFFAYCKPFYPQWVRR